MVNVHRPEGEAYVWGEGKKRKGRRSVPGPVSGARRLELLAASVLMPSAHLLHPPFLLGSCHATPAGGHIISETGWAKLSEPPGKSRGLLVPSVVSSQ